MRIIDERTKVRGVAKAWKAQYFFPDKGWSSTATGDTKPVYDRLRALDTKTATAADVAAIIGNNSWAGPEDCDECGQKSPVVIELGQPPDYESHTAQICPECLRKAAALMGSREPQADQTLPNGESK